MGQAFRRSGQASQHLAARQKWPVSRADRSCCRKIDGDKNALIEKHAPKKKNVSPSKKHHVISQINTCNISLINTFFWICWTQQKIYIYIIISIYNIKAVYKSVDPNIYKEHLTWTEPALVSSTRGRCGSVVTPRWAWCSASRSPQHKGCFKCPCGTKSAWFWMCFFFVWWSGDGIFVGWGWGVRCFGWNEILFDFFFEPCGESDRKCLWSVPVTQLSTQAAQWYFSPFNSPWCWFVG